MMSNVKMDSFNRIGDLENMPPKVQLAILVRMSLRVLPALQVHSTITKSSASATRIIDSVNICCWLSGLVAFIDLDANTLDEIKNKLFEARQDFENVESGMILEDTPVEYTAIRTARAASALIDELQSVDSKKTFVQEDSPTAITEILGIWENNSYFSSEWTSKLLRSLFSDVETYVKKTPDVYYFSHIPLWSEEPEPEIDAFKIDTWINFLIKIERTLWSEFYELVQEGKFDWESPIDMLLDSENYSDKTEGDSRGDEYFNSEIFSGEQKLDPSVTDPDTLLIKQGETSLRFQVHEKIWTLGFDAIIVPTDMVGDIDGIFATAVQEDLGERIWVHINTAVRSHHEFYPDMPLFINLEEFKPRKGLPTSIIVATALGSGKIQNQAGVAAVSAVQYAAKNNIRNIAMPLLGSGHGGLGEKEVLQDMILALGEMGASSGAYNITIASNNESLKDVAFDIARNIPPINKVEEKLKTPDEPKKPVVSIREPELAVLSNDKDTIEDSLNVKDQAHTFAKLLTARDVKLPISIGLFGNWGVGKSYFMHLMREEIKEITASQSPTDDKSTWVRRTAQIEFNAWHYVDSNLWASLAIHIFDDLVKEYAPGGSKDSDIEDLRRQLRADVQSSEEAKLRAETKQDVARKKRQDSLLTLESKKAERNKASRNYGKARWERFIEQNYSNQDEIAKFESIKSTAKQIGIEGVIETAEDALKLYAEFKKLKGRSQTLWLALGQRFSTVPNTLLTLVFIVAVLFATGMVNPVLEYIYATYDLNPDKIFKSAIDNLARGLVFIGPVLTWSASKLKNVSKVSSFLESVNKKLDETDPMASGDNEEAKLREELDKLDAEIKTEQQTIVEADKRIEQSQEELQRIDGGGLVYDFLENRREDSEYKSNLGMISVIRQDFQRLRKLLNDWNKNHGKDKPPIERIILYIDDLDRCHPDQVVEVLQAVHLLLAFDLFAVVVAVDPRWLERSLYKAYVPDLPQYKMEKNAEWRNADEFSPQNYLEKIFQIPFSLTSMKQEGYQKLVKDLIISRSEWNASSTESKVEGKLKKPPQEKTGKKDKMDSHVTGKSKNVKSDSHKEDDSEKTITDVVGSAKLPVAPNLEDIDKGKTQTVKKAVNREKKPESKNEENPILEDWELKYLQSLYPFVDTPRLAKRLVNIYRLLRVRAVKMDGGFTQFIDRANGDYRATLILLAINIGHPEISGKLLLGLVNTPTKSWIKFINSLVKQDENTEDDETLEFIFQTQREQQSVETMVKRLSEVIGTLKEENPEVKLPDDIELFKKWAPEVGRYAFHWNLFA